MSSMEGYLYMRMPPSDDRESAAFEEDEVSSIKAFSLELSGIVPPQTYTPNLLFTDDA